MIHCSDEQPLSELEGGGELLLQLPHTVHPLHENGRPVGVWVTLVAMAYALENVFF